MLDLGSGAAEVCVIGRADYRNGIGAVTAAACELLSRSHPTCIWPTNGGGDAATVQLPSGTVIPVCRDLEAMRVVVFTDVLWNGADDLNFTLVPPGRLRIAHVAYDSDELPARWVHILNDHFDMVLFSSRHLEAVATRSGVRIPIGTLPIALPVEPFLAREDPVHRSGPVRFGSIAAWHARKNNLLLIEAFLDEFGDDESAELVVHSNLVSDDSFVRAQHALARRRARNVTITSTHLSTAARDALVDGVDVVVSCSGGEGYSIGPREALARGRPLVLSDIGAHRDLLGLPGVFPIPTSGWVPARYPELDHMVAGRQARLRAEDVRAALRRAHTYALAPPDDGGVAARKARAAEFSFARLAPSYAELVTPDVRRFHTRAPRSAYVRLPVPPGDPAHAGHLGRGLRARSWVVVPAYDAGFFSIFNTFASNLAWDSADDRVHAVVPDWDVNGVIARTSGPMESFCYGRPEDGNVWCHLFEPPYGLTVADLNDADLLARKGAAPLSVFNEHREPFLTYIHARDLYRRPWFPRFRRQYHRAVSDHVRLLPHHRRELDTFTAAFDGRFMVAAHVKHPSHVIEQADGRIAATDAYIRDVTLQLARRGIDPASDGWGVFLATDQDTVVAQFRDRFGAQVLTFDDVRRTTVEEDAQFRSLPAGEQARMGHMVQHHVAATADAWSVQMAWEVVRDAWAMSRCDVLLHVVSNISTAVSYLNPDLEMVFCEPA